MVTGECILAYTMRSQDNLQGVSSLCNVGPRIQTRVIELGSKGHQTTLPTHTLFLTNECY